MQPNNPSPNGFKPRKNYSNQPQPQMEQPPNNQAISASRQDNKIINNSNSNGNGNNRINQKKKQKITEIEIQMKRSLIRDKTEEGYGYKYVYHEKFGEQPFNPNNSYTSPHNDQYAIDDKHDRNNKSLTIQIEQGNKYSNPSIIINKQNRANNNPPPNTNINSNTKANTNSNRNTYTNFNTSNTISKPIPISKQFQLNKPKPTSQYIRIQQLDNSGVSAKAQSHINEQSPEIVIKPMQVPQPVTKSKNPKNIKYFNYSSNMPNTTKANPNRASIFNPNRVYKQYSLGNSSNSNSQPKFKLAPNSNYKYPALANDGKDKYGQLDTEQKIAEIRKYVRNHHNRIYDNYDSANNSRYNPTNNDNTVPIQNNLVMTPPRRLRDRQSAVAFRTSKRPEQGRSYRYDPDTRSLQLNNSHSNSNSPITRTSTLQYQPLTTNIKRIRTQAIKQNQTQISQNKQFIYPVTHNNQKNQGKTQLQGIKIIKKPGNPYFSKNTVYTTGMAAVNAQPISNANDAVKMSLSQYNKLLVTKLQAATKQNTKIKLQYQQLYKMYKQALKTIYQIQILQKVAMQKQKRIKQLNQQKNNYNTSSFSDILSANMKQQIRKFNFENQEMKLRQKEAQLDKLRKENQEILEINQQNQRFIQQLKSQNEALINQIQSLEGEMNNLKEKFKIKEMQRQRERERQKQKQEERERERQRQRQRQRQKQMQREREREISRARQIQKERQIQKQRQKQKEKQKEKQAQKQKQRQRQDQKTNQKQKQIQAQKQKQIQKQKLKQQVSQYRNTKNLPNKKQFQQKIDQIHIFYHSKVQQLTRISNHLLNKLSKFQAKCVQLERVVENLLAERRSRFNSNGRNFKAVERNHPGRNVVMKNQIQPIGDQGNLASSYVYNTQTNKKVAAQYRSSQVNQIYPTYQQKSTNTPEILIKLTTYSSIEPQMHPQRINNSGTINTINRTGIRPSFEIQKQRLLTNKSQLESKLIIQQHMHLMHIQQLQKAHKRQIQEIQVSFGQKIQEIAKINNKQLAEIQARYIQKIKQYQNMQKQNLQRYQSKYKNQLIQLSKSSSVINNTYNQKMKQIQQSNENKLKNLQIQYKKTLQKLEAVEFNYKTKLQQVYEEIAKIKRYIENCNVIQNFQTFQKQFKSILEQKKHIIYKLLQVYDQIQRQQIQRQELQQIQSQQAKKKVWQLQQQLNKQKKRKKQLVEKCINLQNYIQNNISNGRRKDDFVIQGVYQYEGYADDIESIDEKDNRKKRDISCQCPMEGMVTGFNLQGIYNQNQGKEVFQWMKHVQKVMIACGKIANKILNLKEVQSQENYLGQELNIGVK